VLIIERIGWCGRQSPRAHHTKFEGSRGRGGRQVRGWQLTPLTCPSAALAACKLLLLLLLLLLYVAVGGSRCVVLYLRLWKVGFGGSVRA
jgi:hypothetical protein